MEGTFREWIEYKGDMIFIALEDDVLHIDDVEYIPIDNSDLCHEDILKKTNGIITTDTARGSCNK